MSDIIEITHCEYFYLQVSFSIWCVSGRSMKVADPSPDSWRLCCTPENAEIYTYQFTIAKGFRFLTICLPRLPYMYSVYLSSGTIPRQIWNCFTKFIVSFPFPSIRQLPADQMYWVLFRAGEPVPQGTGWPLGAGTAPNKTQEPEQPKICGSSIGSWQIRNIRKLYIYLFYFSCSFI